jgi:hypothetical protein
VGKDNPINIKPGLETREASQRIHALVFPDGCFHQWGYSLSRGHNVCACGEVLEDGTENPDYFSDTLPDNLRVAMVTAAVEKFGELSTLAGFTKVAHADKLQWEKFGSFNLTLLSMPAPAIAEAIDRLLREENND